MAASSPRSWIDRAACIGNPEPFFGPENEAELARKRREHKAKAICAGCEVRTECLMAAMDTRQKWGVWGGDGEAERPNRRRRELRESRRSA